MEELELLKGLQGAAYGSAALVLLSMSVYFLVRTFSRSDSESRKLFSESASGMAKSYADSQTQQANEFSRLQLQQLQKFTEFLNESKQRDSIITNEYVQLLRGMQTEMANKTRVLMDIQKALADMHEAYQTSHHKLIELHAFIERNHAEVLIMLNKYIHEPKGHLPESKEKPVQPD